MLFFPLTDGVHAVHICGMKLSEWMAMNGIGNGKLARSLGVHRSTISRIRREKTVPSGTLIARIFTLTDGAVPPGEFFPAVGLASEANIDRECAG